jgi:hypothetical protein
MTGREMDGKRGTRQGDKALFERRVLRVSEHQRKVVGKGKDGIPESYLGLFSYRGKKLDGRGRTIAEKMKVGRGR